MELGQSLGHKHTGERFKERDCVVKIPDWEGPQRGHPNLHRRCDKASQPHPRHNQRETVHAAKLISHQSRRNDGRHPALPANNNPGPLAHVPALLAVEVYVVVRIIDIPKLPESQIRKVLRRPHLYDGQGPRTPKDILF